MLIEGLLCIVSLSPVRGPGPRATRLGAIADTLGRRSRIAVLIARDHEDAALSIKTLAERNATGSIQAWNCQLRTIHLDLISSAHTCMACAARWRRDTVGFFG